MNKIFEKLGIRPKQIVESDYWNESSAKSETASWNSWLYRDIAKRMSTILRSNDDNAIPMVDEMLQFQSVAAEFSKGMDDVRALPRISMGGLREVGAEESDPFIREMLDMFRTPVRLANADKLRQQHELSLEEIKETTGLTAQFVDNTTSVTIFNTDTPGVWIIRRVDKPEMVRSYESWDLIGARQLRMPDEMRKRLEEKLDIPLVKRFD